MGNFDFTGFQFGDWKSHDEEDVIVYRVSEGDRYNEILHPEIRDLTAEMTGMDGQYYFGSTYGPKQFDINIAFDSLTEEQFRKLKTVFSTKEPKRLIFDECPYKYYLAKLESPIELSYVCFDEPKKELETTQGIPYKDKNGNKTTIHTVMRNTNTYNRIYKGEGRISFICHYPFAKSVQKTLPSEGSEDWAISSGILSETTYNNAQFDIYNSNNGIIKIYNPGDLPTGFQLYIPFNLYNWSNPNFDFIKIDYNNGVENIASLKLTPPVKLDDTETGFVINSDNGLIQGAIKTNNELRFTKSIYNKNIVAGYFFKLNNNLDNPQLIITKTKITTTNNTETETTSYFNSNQIQIFYNYLYF